MQTPALAQRVKLGEEAVGLAKEIKLQAERKAGEILREVPKNEVRRHERRVEAVTKNLPPLPPKRPWASPFRERPMW